MLELQKQVLVTLLLFTVTTIVFLERCFGQSDAQAPLRPHDRTAYRLPDGTTGNPYRDRVDQMVAVLKEETLQESLFNLSDNDFFSWPGFMSQGIITDLPLSPDLDRETVERIQSNRRFRKVLAELRTLDRQEQARIVTYSLRRELASYTVLYQQYRHDFDRSYLKTANANKGVLTSPPMQTSSSKDGRPTLYGSRLALLGLVLAAGNLELTECEPQIKQVLAQAIQQRDDLYSSEQFHEAYRQFTLMNVSSYNRQVLGTAVIGFSSDGKIGEAEFGPHRVKWTPRMLAVFDSPATRYEIHYLHGVTMIPEDALALPIEYLTPIDDVKFDQIVDQSGLLKYPP